MDILEYLNNPPPPIKEVDAGTLGKAYIRRLNFAEWTEMGRMVYLPDANDKGEPVKQLSDLELYARQIACYILFCLCDETGKRKFKNDDLAKLDNLPPVIAKRLYDEIVSHIGEPDIESIKKKSTATGGTSSAVGSPETEAVTSPKSSLSRQRKSGRNTPTTS